MMGYGGFGLLGGLGMGLGMIAWIVLAGVVVRMVVDLTSSKSIRREDSALEILKQRYARGEIERAEFDLAKKDLV
jgi:putative membrane protein